MEAFARYLVEYGALEMYDYMLDCFIDCFTSIYLHPTGQNHLHYFQRVVQPSTQCLPVYLLTRKYGCTHSDLFTGIGQVTDLCPHIREVLRLRSSSVWVSAVPIRARR